MKSIAHILCSEPSASSVSLDQMSTTFDPNMREYFVRLRKAVVRFGPLKKRGVCGETLICGLKSVSEF